MATFELRASAAVADVRLRDSLRELQRAEQNAVLWFADILERKLYRELGFSSIYHYATERLGFSKSKTAQFIHLAQSMKTLPRLKHSVESGELSWTKAREVAKVATPRTESRWIEKAKGTGRRLLEEEVRTSRARARKKHEDRAQTGLALLPQSPTVEAKELDVPVSVSVRFTPEQLARYEALMERIRKSGERGERAEVLLAALEQYAVVASSRRESTESGTEREAEAASVDDSGQEFTRVNSGNSINSKVLREKPVAISGPVYQIFVQRCEDCGSGSVITNGGPKRLSLAVLASMMCDARVAVAGKRNTATIAPSVRRKVLERDRYTCATAGCGSTKFLEVHHIHARADGGKNADANLITLCSGCHKTLHEFGRTRAGRGVEPDQAVFQTPHVAA